MLFELFLVNDIDKVTLISVEIFKTGSRLLFQCSWWRGSSGLFVFARGNDCSFRYFRGTNKNIEGGKEGFPF